MIRSEELLDILIADLHFHHYIVMQEDSIFPKGGPLTIVANKSQKKHIQRYIDDLFIDLFFRTHKFKPIIIHKKWTKSRYSKEGIVDVDNQIFTLDLSNPYDRYTFVDCISSIFGLGINKYISLFSDNQFIDDLGPNFIKYGPIWGAISLELYPPEVNALHLYLNNKYGSKLSKFNPHYRALEIVEYANYHKDSDYSSFYNGYNFPPSVLKTIDKCWNDYIHIKDSDIFGEYTVEDVLMIYSLLVDKFVLKENGLLEFIALFYDPERKGNFVNEFGKYELENDEYECIEPFVRSKDLFLRFTSETKSRAFTFQYKDSCFAFLKFFEHLPIRTVTRNNTLPLPYLYCELYK